MTTRYRCTACGNLTRFDVTTSRRTRAFHHYSVGGDLEIEDEEVLAQSTDEVSCRWCGSAKNVIELHEDDTADDTADHRADDTADDTAHDTADDVAGVERASTDAPSA